MKFYIDFDILDLTPCDFALDVVLPKHWFAYY